MQSGKDNIGNLQGLLSKTAKMKDTAQKTANLSENAAEKSHLLNNEPTKPTKKYGSTHARFTSEGWPTAELSKELQPDRSQESKIKKAQQTVDETKALLKENMEKKVEETLKNAESIDTLNSQKEKLKTNANVFKKTQHNNDSPSCWSRLFCCWPKKNTDERDAMAEYNKHGYKQIK